MQTNHRLTLNKFKPIAQFPPKKKEKKKNQIDYRQNTVLNSVIEFQTQTQSITDAKRNTAKTTIKSTLYKTKINEVGVKNLRKAKKKKLN